MLKSLLIRFDTIFAIVLYLLANISKPLKSNKSLWKNPAIIRPGGLGDLVLLTLALKRAGKSVSDYFWIIEQRSEIWAQYLNLNYEVYDRSPFLKILRLFGKFEKVYCSEQRYGLAASYAQWVRSKNGRITGFSTNKFSRIFHERVDYDPLDAHEIDEFEKLLIGPVSPNKTGESFEFSKSKRQGPILILLGGSHEKSRSFSAEDWLKWIELTLGNEPAILGFGPADSQLALEICSLDMALTSFSGDFNGLVELIKSSSRVLTIDGGLCHVAAYFDIPITVLFTAGRDLKWRPMSLGSEIYVNMEAACRPCTIYGKRPICRNQFACKDIGRVSKI